MSNGKGLSIIALIIGISGLGLGVYTFFFPQVQVVDHNFGIQNTWFNYDSTAYPTSPPGTYIDIDALTINFTVNAGESVHFLFNTFAIVTAGSPPAIQFNFVLDGVRKGIPDYPELYFSTSSGSQYGSATLQVVVSVSTGFHNLTVSIIGSDASNGIRDSTLIVQTFIP